MYIDCSELNRYAVVYKKDIIEKYGRHDVEMLCVPFHGTLNFLDEKLKFFKWNAKHDMYLVQDVVKYNVNIPNNMWNDYAIFDIDVFDNLVPTDYGFKYNTDCYLFKHVSLMDIVPSNKTLSYISGISIYEIMYGLYIFYNRLKKKKEIEEINNKLDSNYKTVSDAKEFINAKINESIQDKVKDTKGKAKLHLVPQQILYDIAEVREYGNKKYPTGGEDNWKLGDPKDYLDAAYRHLTKMVRDGIDSKDEESGIEHYKHFATNAAFICGFMGGEHEDISRAVED